MATQEEIKVGSIVTSHAAMFSGATGLVLAYPSRAAFVDGANPPAADIYWFKGKYIDWEYIDYLKVLVY